MYLLTQRYLSLNLNDLELNWFGRDLNWISQVNRVSQVLLHMLINGFYGEGLIYYVIDKFYYRKK